MFAFPVSGDADDVLGEATTRVRIVGEAVASSAPKAAGATSTTLPGDEPPWVLIGGGVALAVTAGFVIRRVFADL